MSKLILLGGSQQQIPAIQYAKDRGYNTILCDYLSDNPGQYYADKFYCVSTTDKEKILEIARAEQIDGILAYASDPAAPTAAFVAEEMGLPTNPYESVDILTNKDKFRKFLYENNFHTPYAKAFDSVEDAKEKIDNFKLPVIIKPVDSSGSKGVSKLSTIDNLEEQIEFAMSYSRMNRVIIEEYVEMNGYQIAGDGFSIEGELVFRCFGNDHFNQGDNSFVPISASFPYNNNKIQEKIHNEIQRLLNLLNMRTGAYNFDIRIDKNDNVYLMEVGPRNGGNYIPQVIKYATNIDMLELSIKAAMGEDIDNVEMIDPNGYWSYFAVHSTQAGILKEIKIKENVRNENIVEKHMNYQIGEKVPAFRGSNGNIGILIMKFKNMEEMLYMMDNPGEWIEVVVEEI